MSQGNDFVTPAFSGVTVDANGNVVTTDSYFYLPGRPGGQVANFSSLAGQGGTLQANPVDPNNRTITVASKITISLPAQTSGIGFFTLTQAGATVANPILITVVAPSQYSTTYTFLRLQGGTVKTGGGAPFVLFNIATIFGFQGAVSAGQIFFYAPQYGDDGVARTISVNTRALILQPNFKALTAGSIGNPSAVTAVEITPTVDASWNALATATFVLFSNPAGTHAVGVTDYIGIDVPDAIVKPTNVWTIRNLEDRARMHHRGSVLLGGAAVATQELVSLLRITAGSAGGHGSVTFDEEAADPAQPTADNQARVYVKNNKLVIQWNLAGTTLYTTVPLNSAGPYPVNPVWTTDTVAP